MDYFPLLLSLKRTQHNKYIYMCVWYLCCNALVSFLFSSDGSYPKDEGSSQEVKQSLFVGESQNRGTNGGQNKYWGVGGADGKMRTLPRNRWGGANRPGQLVEWRKDICEQLREKSKSNDCRGWCWRSCLRKIRWEKQTREREPARQSGSWTDGQMGLLQLLLAVGGLVKGSSV